MGDVLLYVPRRAEQPTLGSIKVSVLYDDKSTASAKICLEVNSPTKDDNTAKRYRGTSFIKKKTP